MGELADNGLNRRIQDADAVAKECDEVEVLIVELKVAYEQYFLGVERMPPNELHTALKRRLNKLRNSFVRQTAMKFRVNGVQSKFSAYERLWLRTVKEIEDGTYKRDVYKAKRKLQEPKKDKKAEAHELEADPVVELEPEEVVDAPAPVAAAPAIPSVAPVVSKTGIPAVAPVSKPGIPAVPAVTPPRITSPGGIPAVAPLKQSSPGIPAIPAVRTNPNGVPAVPRAATGSNIPAVPPARAVSSPGLPRVSPPSGSDGAVSDAKLKAVYDAYVTAKKRCQEDTTSLSYETVAANLRKQVPELMKKHNAQGVDFKVVIKDGKAVLKAVPK